MSTPPFDWSAILADAVSKPGVISKAYTTFWRYSVGNQLLALFQCHGRGLAPGPINTFQGWRNLARHVRKGEKAITLCMPVTCKRNSRHAVRPDGRATEHADGHNGDDGHAVATLATPEQDGDGPAAPYTRFVYKPHWWVLAQTDGADYQPADLPQWNEERALASLEIERGPFRHPDGNCQGYALARQVAISPVAALPSKTLFHELAHVVLGHTAESQQMVDDERTSQNIREVEAECVALICCESLTLPGAEFARGYIQHWLGDEKIGDRSAQKIFRAADAILKSGRPRNDAGVE